MPTDAAFPFDVKFTVDGTDYGFMLVSPKGESKQIEFSESQMPEANRISIKETVTNQDFDPRIDTPYAMSTFKGGVGQVEYDFNDNESYWWSNGVVTHVDGKVYMAPPITEYALPNATNTITGMLTYLTAANTRWDYLWEGPRIWVRDASSVSNGWALAYTASVDITNFCIMDGIGLIAVPSLSGTTDFMYHTNIVSTGWTPTQVNHTPFSTALGKPKYFHVTRGTCFALVDKNKVFYTTDPTIDGWAGPIDTTLTGNVSGPPGDDSYPFVGVNSVNDFLFVRKKDAVYSIDSQQDVLETIWQWKDKPSEHNFKYATTGDDKFLFAVGPEVYAYDPTTGISTSLGLSKKDGFTVREILGVASDNQYVYVAARVRVPIIRSADSFVVFRGVKIRPGTFAFEVLYEDTSLSGKTYGGLYAFPRGVGTMLYWSRDVAGSSITTLMDIPAEWDETTSGSYKTSATLWTSLSRSGFPGFKKRHLYFNMNGRSLSATNSIAVNYTTDEGVNYTALSTAEADAYEANFSNVNSNAIGFKFDFVSAGTVTPVLLNYNHHQRIRFKYLPTATLAVRVASDIETRDLTRIQQDVWDIWDNIKTLRTTDSEITYKDFLGNDFKVTVDVIAVKPTRHQEIMDYEEEAVIVITRADRGS